MNHHTKDLPCPLCEEKRRDAHPVLQGWWERVKAQFPDAHLSWTFRDEANQNLFYLQGKTRCKWPNSAHNQKPSRAMDLFQLREDGVPSWHTVYFEKIQSWLLEKKAPLQWAGDWTRFQEYDHWQIPPDA